MHIPRPDRRTLVVVALVLVLLLPAGYAIAQTGVQWHSPGTTTSHYQAPNGPNISESADWSPTSSVPIRDGVVDFGVVEFRGSGSAEVTGWSNDTISLTNVSTSSQLEVDDATKQRVDVGDGVTSLDFAAVDLATTDTELWINGGSGTIEVHGLPTNTSVVVRRSGGSDTMVQTDGSGVATFSVSSGEEISLEDTSSPELSNAAPKDDTTVSNEPVELEIDVTDRDFSTGSESVTVTFYNGSDGSVMGNDTLSSNGTATTTVDSPVGGQNSWYAIAEDDYSNSVDSRDQAGGAYVYNVPDELRIYQETQPDQLIADDVPLRVRFITEGEQRVIQRNATNGTVDMTGLAPDKRYIVTVRARDTQNYTYRRIVVDSIIETQEIYLLNKTNPNSQIIFGLDDPTGQFPPENTTLYVEKPITKDFDGDGTNETRYQVIAGDVFGASGEFPAVLRENERYRLRVETKDEAQSRILGAYSVTGPDTTQLQIQRVEPKGDTSSGSAVYGGLETKDGQRVLAVRYIDPDENTDQVEYRVERPDGSVWIENTTRTADKFADVYPLPDNASEGQAYIVKWTVERNGGQTSGSFVAGDIPEIAERFDLNPQLLGIISWALVLSMMGLVVLVRPILAPLSGVGIATLLTIIGTVSIPGPALGIAGAVSVLVLFGGR